MFLVFLKGSTMANSTECVHAYTCYIFEALGNKLEQVNA